MDTTLVALIISILGAVISVSTFALNRKDKAVKDAKDINMGLINYRLDELDKNVQKVLDKLDRYEKEVDDKIEKAMKQHIENYHKRV